MVSSVNHISTYILDQRPAYNIVCGGIRGRFCRFNPLTAGAAYIRVFIF